VVLPTLEDVPDGIGHRFPIVIGVFDQLKKRTAILSCRLKRTDKLARSRRKLPEMWLIEPAIEGRRKRKIRDEN
jgi:hypothetical protein